MSFIDEMRCPRCGYYKTIIYVEGHATSYCQTCYDKDEYWPTEEIMKGILPIPIESRFEILDL